MFHDLVKVRSALLHEIPKQKFLVVGDLMLDRYLSGTCDRISPEAPVPVIRLAKRSVSLGGAANVAHNLSRLGASVDVIGAVGDDESGRLLIEACESANIGADGICVFEDRSTVVKTRVLAGDQQIVRIDEESTSSLNDKQCYEVLEGLIERLEKDAVGAVILSDYAKGLCTSHFCQRVMEECRRHKTSVYVDPKGVDYRKYLGATAIKPNQQEMRLIAQAEGWESSDLIGTARKLRQLLSLQFVGLTLGSKGMILIESNSEESFPTAAREVFDVSGAGDAVIAALVAGICGNLSLRDAIVLGNLAAAQVVSRVGCVPVDRAELILAVQRQTRASGSAKLFTLDELVQISQAWKDAKQTTALTTGYFDVLLASHVRILEQAASNADRLIVALSSDEAIMRMEGERRPQTPLAARVEVLSSLQCVDAVVVLENDSPVEFIQALKPDHLVDALAL